MMPLRPVIMTAAAMIIGMLPISLGRVRRRADAAGPTVSADCRWRRCHAAVRSGVCAPRVKALNARRSCDDYETRESRARGPAEAIGAQRTGKK
jgi:hypothetical protein